MFSLIPYSCPYSLFLLSNVEIHFSKNALKRTRNARVYSKISVGFVCIFGLYGGNWHDAIRMSTEAINPCLGCLGFVRPLSAPRGSWLSITCWLPNFFDFQSLSLKASVNGAFWSKIGHFCRKFVVGLQTKCNTTIIVIIVIIIIIIIAIVIITITITIIIILIDFDTRYFMF